MCDDCERHFSSKMSSRNCFRLVIAVPFVEKGSAIATGMPTEMVKWDHLLDQHAYGILPLCVFFLIELLWQCVVICICNNTLILSWRPTLLLENYQPWLDLKVSSKVDASISEVASKLVSSLCMNVINQATILSVVTSYVFQVLELILENFVYPWYR